MRRNNKKPAAANEEEEQQQEPAAAKEEQQDDDERYDTVAKIELVYEKKTHERIQGDRKFKQIKHKDDYGQHHTTY